MQALDETVTRPVYPNSSRRIMAKILLSDDHAILRKGLRQLLLEDRSIQDVGEASTGSETLDKLRQTRWDLLILDINMPDRSGIDILRQVHASYPDTRVLILSGFPEKQYAVNVLRAGASGYLNKEMAPEELLAAVKTVLAGKRYVSPALAELLVTELDHDSDKPAHAQLSEREFQIFCKLAAGRTVSDIAAELCLSVKTISTYRSRVMEKMNFTSNADITAYALRNNLMD
ncbi:MAG: response regulator transcription factor [Steroidobacteraceae bacterium]